MGKWQYETTNYREAWLAYRRSGAYFSAVLDLKAKGIQQPYSSNILQSAFAAGWRASGVKIRRICIQEK